MYQTGAAQAVALIVVMLITITVYLWYLNRGRHDREVSIL